MFGHQLGQDLVLGLDLLLQVGDPFLVGGVVAWPFRFEGSRAVLEELLLPAVEDRGLQAELIAAVLRSAPFPANAAAGWGPSLPAPSAFVPSSCVLSFTLLAERLLHVQLNRSTVHLEMEKAFSLHAGREG